MDLTLTRKEFRSDGIFSELRDSDGNLVAHTLEHAYEDGKGGWTPKLADGTYTCQRGPHRLHGMTEDFITFEVLGVPDFQGLSVTGLLLHWGNWNRDSEGCILTGQAEATSGGVHMVTASRTTFAAFMQLEDGLDTYTLTVDTPSAT